jgi:hypothetical protein
MPTKNHNNLQTFPPNPRRFGEHEPLQEHPISIIINLLQSKSLSICCNLYNVFPYQFLLKIKLLSTGKPIAFPWFCRQVPELNGLVGRSLGLASGCARRPPLPARLVIYEETH